MPTTTEILDLMTGAETGRGTWQKLNEAIEQRASRNFVTLVAGDSPYAITDADQVVYVDSTAGSVTVDLPAAADSAGRVLVFKKLVAGNTLTIDGNASELVEGGATLALTAALATARLHCNGTAWFSI
jgi:hypothetical protein